MSEFKVATWAAVSSKAQAGDDKVSLDEQLTRCRAMCLAREWQIVLEVEVPGHSREFTSLDAAISEIPDLGRILELARAGQINLLVCFDLDRFRGVQMAVVKTLAAYGAQTYSLSQPVEPVPPKGFMYYTSETPYTMSTLSSYTSDASQRALRRRWAFGMPRRVSTAGLHFNNRLPFGYIKPPGRELDTKVVGIQVVAECALILEMKRRYEAGDSGDDIGEWLTESGVLTRRGHHWSRNQVLEVLTNPYYAGLVTQGKNTVRRDPMRTGLVRHRKPRADWVISPGKHQALWTPEDYERLVTLREQRGQRAAGKTKNTHYFSHLLKCQMCKGALRVSRRLKADGQMAYRCANGWLHEGHALAHEKTIIKALLEVLRAMVPGRMPAPAAKTPAPNPEAERLAAALAELEATRTRYQRMAGRGTITEDELITFQLELKAEVATLNRQLAAARDVEARQQRRARVHQNAAELLEHFDALWTDPPERTNARLLEILDRIEVKGQTVTDVFFRDS